MKTPDRPLTRATPDDDESVLEALRFMLPTREQLPTVLRKLAFWTCAAISGAAALSLIGN